MLGADERYEDRPRLLDAGDHDGDVAGCVGEHPPERSIREQLRRTVDEDEVDVLIAPDPNDVLSRGR